MNIIILAGGSGTRLWPLSKSNCPKQFVKFDFNSKTLFQQTFERSLGLTSVDNIYIVTNEKYKHLINRDISELGIENYNQENIILEPAAKNTLPAICAGVYSVRSNEKILIMPSDQLIIDSNKFTDVVRDSLILAEKNLVTFGVKPNKPHTGYGYIKPSLKIGNGYMVEEFKEKPNLEVAKEYVEKGYFWNAGIFLFDKELFDKELEKYEKDIRDAFITSENIKEAFSKIEVSISIDYGIMEKSNIVAVSELNTEWNDLGDYNAIYEISKLDEYNNATNDGALKIDSNNNLIMFDDGVDVSVIGLNNCVVVNKNNALLICNRNETQQIKIASEHFKEKQKNNEFSENRPWGYYKVLEEGINFKVKKISVFSHQKLSLQSHKFRSEHWTVVKGTAIVTIGRTQKTLKVGESVFIKVGEKHRLENCGQELLEIIEVQTGEYLGEDDIIRFSDDYGRE